MNKKAYSIAALSTSTGSFINSSRFWVSSEKIIYDAYFFENLRIEKLRAQRSKSTLSIILLALEKETDTESINTRAILDGIQTKIRNTDISGFINHKTIGVLLPDTDENGANKLCEKLVNGHPQFSATTSSYPDHIFESLEKIGVIQPDAHPFELKDSMDNVWFKLFFKRVLDIIGSIIGILILAPVMLVTALVIKVTSPGPVIFSQIRLGKKGIPFKFYKFRSMHVDMDDKIHREYIQNFINGHLEKINQGDAEEPFYKMKADPRITRIGRFIRKTSIDEIPQFFNVLKGDMSLVGPRPPLSYEAEKYQSWHLRRIVDMKPGITGLWQIEGRSKTEWDDAVRLDIRYIQNWSLIMDLKILFKTVYIVLWCRGAV